MTNIVEITTDCLCMDYEGNPSDECWGCYEDSKELMHQMIINWLGENDAASDVSVLIEGKGMTWQGLDGTAMVNANSILSALALDRSGQYRLEFYQDGKKLTAKRWSHDEPMGASFKFTIQKEN